MEKLSQREYIQGKYTYDPEAGYRITKPGDFYVDKYGKFYFAETKNGHLNN